jgi:hypothetical protein
VSLASAFRLVALDYLPQRAHIRRESHWQVPVLLDDLVGFTFGRGIDGRRTRAKRRCAGSEDGEDQSCGGPEE